MFWSSIFSLKLFEYSLVGIVNRLWLGFPLFSQKIFISFIEVTRNRIICFLVRMYSILFHFFFTSIFKSTNRVSSTSLRHVIHFFVDQNKEKTFKIIRFSSKTKNSRVEFCGILKLSCQNLFNHTSWSFSRERRRKRWLVKVSREVY